jgi:hypothetical protein
MYSIYQVGVPALGQLAAWWPTIETKVDESHQFMLMMRFIAFSECKEQSRTVYLYEEKSKKSTDQQSTRDAMKNSQKRGKKKLASDSLLLKNGT